MKTTHHILSIFTVGLLISGCNNQKQPELKTVAIENHKEKPINPDATYAKAEFTITGMTCAIGCAATIEKKIAKMDGVTFAKVDFEKQLAMVAYDKAKVNLKNLEETVTTISNVYKVGEMKTVSSFSN